MHVRPATSRARAPAARAARRSRSPCSLNSDAKAAESRRAALAVADILLVALVCLAACSENAWERAAQEDGVIEWSTAFSFITAALLFARRRPRLELIARVGLVVFCVFVAGEEISWGQRRFAFQPPEIFLERNFQQEVNLHNVLMNESSGLNVEIDSKHLVMLIAFCYGVIGPLVVRLPRLRAFAELTPPLSIIPHFIAVIVFEQVYPVDLTGEGAELFLGVLFVVSAAAGRGQRTVLIASAAPLIGGALTAPLLALVVFGADVEGSAQARDELARLAQDLELGRGPKLDRGRSIHKRVFTATRDGYFKIEGGAFHEGLARRRDRVGYFLDPWNNPYWVYLERRATRGLVYSFGPNRQRDTAVKEGDVASGDDLLGGFHRPPD